MLILRRILAVLAVAAAGAMLGLTGCGSSSGSSPSSTEARAPQGGLLLGKGFLCRWNQTEQKSVSALVSGWRLWESGKGDAVPDPSGGCGSAPTTPLLAAQRVSALAAIRSFMDQNLESISGRGYGLAPLVQIGLASQEAVSEWQAANGVTSTTEAASASSTTTPTITTTTEASRPTAPPSMTAKAATKFFRAEVAVDFNGVVATGDFRGCVKDRPEHFTCTAYVRDAQGSLSTGQDVIGTVDATGGSMTASARKARSGEIQSWFARTGGTSF